MPSVYRSRLADRRWQMQKGFFSFVERAPAAAARTRQGGGWLCPGGRLPPIVERPPAAAARTRQAGGWLCLAGRFPAIPIEGSNDEPSPASPLHAPDGRAEG